jgi:hypothetical protein
MKSSLISRTSAIGAAVSIIFSASSIFRDIMGTQNIILITPQKVINIDGTVKSFRCKARESLGMRRTYRYAAMTEDEAQSRPWRDRWTFYKAVNSTFLE